MAPWPVPCACALRLTLALFLDPIPRRPSRYVARRDTCVAIAISLNTVAQTQTVIWSVERLPSDVVRIAPVPLPLGTPPRLRRLFGPQPNRSLTVLPTLVVLLAPWLLGRMAHPGGSLLFCANALLYLQHSTVFFGQAVNRLATHSTGFPLGATALHTCALTARAVWAQPALFGRSLGTGT